MNANELADELEKITTYKEAEHDIFSDKEKLKEAATMLRQQQDEIDAMRNRFTLAFWHDTFVEVKKPNSDLIYRFKLDETNDS